MQCQQELKEEIEGCKIDDSEDEETTVLIQDPKNLKHLIPNNKT